jgi:hypothetical protein
MLRKTGAHFEIVQPAANDVSCVVFYRLYNNINLILYCRKKTGVPKKTVDVSG